MVSITRGITEGPAGLCLCNVNSRFSQLKYLPLCMRNFLESLTSVQEPSLLVPLPVLTGTSRVLKCSEGESGPTASSGDVRQPLKLGVGSFCYPLSAAARHAPTIGGPSPSPIPDLPGIGDHPRSPSPICRGSGVHPHRHPRFAADRGSSPSPIPIGDSAHWHC